MTIKTMGRCMVKHESYQRFAIESATTISIIFASSFGIPLSTTHTIHASHIGKHECHKNIGSPLSDS